MKARVGVDPLGDIATALCMSIRPPSESRARRMLRLAHLLTMLYVYDPPWTSVRTGEVLGVSASRVHQLRNYALRVLHYPTRLKYLEKAHFFERHPRLGHAIHDQWQGRPA